MSAFVDKTLASLSDPQELAKLLDPPGDATHARARALVDAMYEAPYARIHEVRKLQVESVELERPLFVPRESRGTWTQTSPGYTQADAQWQDVDRLAPVWLDLSAQLSVTLVLEIDSGAVESIVTHEIEDITSLADFKSRFRYLDLDAFLAEHEISTVGELRERFQYLLTEVKLRQKPAFDAADPANRLTCEVSAAVLIRDALDVGEALRAAKLARALLGRTAVYQSDGANGFEVTSPYAPVVIFPAATLQGSPFTEAGLRTLFAHEGVVAILAQ